jgi:hypothetical protein
VARRRPRRCPLLLLAACSAGTTPHASHPASRTPSPSPSAACPSGADVVAAADRTASVHGYQPTRRGVMACEAGYATAEVLYPGSDPAVVVLHLVNGQWQTLTMGTDVCEGEGDDGQRRPQWMVGVPDSVVTAAECQPGFYHD